MKAGFSVGLVGPAAPPAGGMAAQTEQLHRLLLQEGIEVRFVQTNRPYRPAWLSSLKGLRAVTRLADYLSNLWRLLGQVDVVHVMSNSGWSWQLYSAPVIWLARARGCPVIINYRGGSAQRYLSSSLRWVKPSLDRADALVVPSSYLEQVFEGFGYNARVIPNIIDQTRFQAGASQRSLQKPLRLVVVRNLESIYGIDTAIRVVACLVDQGLDIELSIAGSGPEEDGLKRLVADLGLGQQVVFLGRLAREEIPALYQSADIFLNTSRVDNMPNSVLEALASGVPVVTTDAGGIPWMVQHEQTALIYPVDDIKALRDGIERLVADGDLRHHLIAQGLLKAQACSWPQVKAQWLALYQHCVRSNDFRLQKVSR